MKKAEWSSPPWSDEQWSYCQRPYVLYPVSNPKEFLFCDPYNYTSLHIGGCTTYSCPIGISRIQGTFNPARMHCEEIITEPVIGIHNNPWNGPQIDERHDQANKETGKEGIPELDEVSSQKSSEDGDEAGDIDTNEYSNVEGNTLGEHEPGEVKGEIDNASNESHSEPHNIDSSKQGDVNENTPSSDEAGVEVLTVLPPEKKDNIQRHLNSNQFIIPIEEVHSLQQIDGKVPAITKGKK